MKRISTGIENFKELIDNNYYYIDKTMLIADVLSDKVLHYTRPRRFGKTVNMSMLYYFFSNKETENAYLFDGLKVSENKEITKHQNQYPVIFMTLKDLSRENMKLQIDKFKAMVAKLVEDNSELIESPYLSSPEKQLLNSYRCKNVSESDLRDALYNLSLFLEKHYHQKVIILIDEYDVPLQSAFNHGYHDEMVEFLKSALSAGLKTNDALERGILTGCLRIAKESIFTGLNNFTVRTISDKEASEYFGFTQKEIDGLLNYYNLISKRQDMKDWYDGY
ncbi:AAA family ATPase, partial [Thomasclavelia sp.]|uniref:AAA family ATPase n=1 Tax=Thomasclavelia sp. TaxID=3025757 RepID=UPI0025FE67A3